MSSLASRTSVSLVATLMLAVSTHPLAAQRAESAPRVWRMSPNDSSDLQIRKLLRIVDSLARLYDDEELNANERRRVGVELNQMVAQFEQQRLRLMPGGAQAGGTFKPTYIPRIESLDRVGTALDMARTLARGPAQSKGWIGIVVSGAPTEFRDEGDELFVHYLSYPRIATVDPSSPAQRAGIVPNDTLLAFDGRDVREGEISMTRLLRPMAKVMIRVRRDGRVRELPVIVAEAPTRIKQRREVEFSEVRTPFTVFLPPMPGMPGMPRMPAMPALAPTSPRTPAPYRAPAAPPPGVMSVQAPMFTLASNGVAGAMMVTVTAGLAKTLGLSSGVLITNAPPSSPVAQSGLRDGDVIMKVGGESVRDVDDVRELVARAVENGERKVEVDYVREKRAHKVTLRW
jgi:C-terminal processing protease CtpA/Prc